MQMWLRSSVVSQTKFQSGEEMWCVKSDVDHGMIVGARRGGLSISETADLLRFSRKTVSRVCREWCKKQKNIQWAAVLQVEMRC